MSTWSVWYLGWDGHTDWLSDQELKFQELLYATKKVSTLFTFHIQKFNKQRYEAGELWAVLLSWYLYSSLQHVWERYFLYKYDWVWSIIRVCSCLEKPWIILTLCTASYISLCCPQWGFLSALWILSIWCISTFRSLNLNFNIFDSVSTFSLFSAYATFTNGK